MARQPDASKQRRWLDLMHRWHESQLTVREFCERHRLSEPNFYVWRRVLRERGLLHDPPVPAAATPAAPTLTAFVKLTLDAAPATATAVDLVLSERRLLRVRPGFDPSTLLQLVRLLEEPR
jgi:transposase-like protein